MTPLQDYEVNSLQKEETPSQLHQQEGVTVTMSHENKIMSHEGNQLNELPQIFLHLQDTGENDFQLSIPQLYEITQVLSSSESILRDNPTLLSSLILLISNQYHHLYVSHSPEDPHFWSVELQLDRYKCDFPASKDHEALHLEHIIQNSLCVSLLFERMQQRTAAPLINTMFPEDSLEMSIGYMTLCVKYLFSPNDRNSPSDEELSDADIPKSKKKKKSLNSTALQSGLDLSLVENFKNCLCRYLSAMRRGLLELPSISDKLCALFSELSFAIFKSTCLTAKHLISTPRKATKSPRNQHKLIELIPEDGIPEAALRILCNLFASVKSHRGYILQDVLSYVAYCSSHSDLFPKISFLTLFGRNGVPSYCDKAISPASGVILALVQSLVKVDKPEHSENTSMGQDFLENIAKSAIVELNTMASCFMAEITRRCRNKDTGNEYRMGLNVLIHDLLNVQEQLTLPAAALLLTTFVRRSTLDISDGVSAPGSGGGEKSDLSYILFLVDIFGGLGARLCEIVNSVENVLGVDDITKKILKQTWTLLQIDSQLKVSKSTTNIHTRASKSKKQKQLTQNQTQKLISVELAMHIYSLLANIVLEVVCDKVASESDTRRFEDVKTVLNFNQETQIASVDFQETLTKMTENQMMLQPKLFDKFLNSGTFVVPDLSILLNACDASVEQISIFPHLSCSDLHHYWLLQYIVAKFDNIKLESPNDPSNTLFSSLISNTSLWMMNKIRNGQLQVAEFAYRILLNFRRNLGKFREGNKILMITDPQEMLYLRFKPTLTFYSYEWASYCYSNIQRKNRFLQNDFTAIQKSLIFLFSHGSPQVRSRVVRSLNLLVKVDSTLFENTTLRESVIERFNDVAISVREEVVKLVGSYILEPRHDVESAAKMNENYLSGLLIRLRDKGVSVRKSVVNILRDVLLHQPHHPRYSEICLRLLERSMNPKEEDTLKDVIQNTFQQVWFSPAPDEAIQSNASWSVLSTPTRMRKQESTLESISPIKSPIDRHDDKYSTPARSEIKLMSIVHVEATAAQIVDVVDYSLESGCCDTDWLVKLIRDVLHGSNNPSELTAQTKKRQISSLHHCEKLIDSFLNLLFFFEHSLKEKVEQNNKRSPQETIVAIFVAFSCFCKAHPPYVIRHIHTLLPYLKGENGLTVSQDSILCFHLMRMISLALEIPVQTSIQDEINLAGGSDASPLGVTQLGIWESRVDEISSDLVRIALNYPILTVQPAIECLCQLATHIAHHGTYILNLAKKCFDSISTIAQTFSIENISLPGNNKIGLNSTQIARIQRSIVVLGAICEQTNKCSYIREIDARETLEICQSTLFGASDSVLKSISERALNSSCYVCVKFCLSLDHDTIQSRAAQALCSVFVGKPYLILAAEKDGILQWLLGSSAQTSTSVISKTLQSLNLVLMEEERRLELGVSIDQIIGSSSSIGTRVQGKDLGADGTITGNVLRRHLSVLLELMTDSADAEVRLNALKLIGTLLNHGMVHPMDVFSSIIGMLGDDDDNIRQTGLSLLIEQDEKCSTFLDSRIIDGLETAYRIQKQRYGECYPHLAYNLDTEASLLTSPNGRTVDGSQISPHLKRIAFISALYASCYRGNKKRRMDFIVALLRRCELHCQRIATARSRIVTSVISQSHSPLLQVLQSHSNNDDKCSISQQTLTNLLETSIQSFELTSFLILVLSSLPFCWVDEPLSAIYWISRNSNVASSIYEKILRSSLSETFATEYIPQIDLKHKSKQPRIVDEIDESLHAYEDQLLILKNDSSELFIKHDVETQLISLLIIESVSRILVSRLKLYFKSVFSLSDERCLSFTPSYDKEVSDGSSQRTGQLPISEKDKDCHRDSIFTPLPEFLTVKFYRSEYESEKDFLKSLIKAYNCLYSLVHGDSDDLTLIQRKSNSTKENRKSSKSRSNKTPTPQKKGAELCAKTPKRKRKSVARFGAGTLNSDDDPDNNDSDYEG